MLLNSNEMRFDFSGASFTASDNGLLGWVFNQFLYGEITGIQCGHWLYRAPHLNAAAFLAKQAQEELSHVRKILRILSLLGERPAPAHPLIRFLSTGMMGGSWGEHVALEMALGEGLVLSVFYAVAETIEHSEIKKILEGMTVEEERHVDFGERETLEWIKENPGSRKLILGQALIQWMALTKFKKFILKKILTGNENHTVLLQFEKFYEKVLGGFDLRIQRLGLSDLSLKELSLFSKWDLVFGLPWRKLSRRVFSKKSVLLTSSYLTDPAFLAEEQRFRPELPTHE